MPAFKNHTSYAGVPRTTRGNNVRGLNLRTNIPIFEERNYKVTGITYDATGVALGDCTVLLFDSANDTLAQTTVSDANGNYSFVVDKTKNWYVVSYKGTPVQGVTVRTLVGA